ncbi:flagellar hook-associated protein FlgK [Variovorax sp. RHLX14]|uniref:flagellar hook-associated protein FlgK n=1 Tax=Variovorax sp. RHLX14 TaxID=1259731 RepID=UPI003F470E29
MSSLLNVGARALLANQIALATTGHNIANASTAGYSRQSAVMSQVEGQYTGGGYIGKGVQVTTVERAHSEFLTRQAAVAGSVSAMDNTRATQLGSLEDIFQGGKSGLGASVSEMLNAFTDVASTPGDITARNVVLTRADEMATRFRNAETQLDDLQTGVNSQLSDSVKTINSLATRIGTLNEQIARSTGTGQSPNDLLDQRDQALRELNQHVQTSSVAADDGTVSVFVGSQALVLGNSTARMSIGAGGDGTSKLTITRGALTSEITESTLAGGSVAGLLRFQNTDMAEARNGLGRMAIAISAEVNAQNRLGVDLDGKAGADIFAPIALPDALPSATNTGNATIGAKVSDATALIASSYQVEFGANGSVAVTRTSDGKISNFAGPMPITIDGLQLSLGSGAAADGDSYVMKPYTAAAGAMLMAMSSPRELAAASPVEARTGVANTGSVAVGGLAATKSDPNLGVAVTLTFNAAGTFDVSGTGTGNPTGVSYVAGQTISYNGWSLTMTGTPKAGDTLTVQASNTGYSSLNTGNAKALLALRDKAVFEGASMVDGYAGLMTQVGVRSQSAQYSASVSGAIATSLETERTGVSGVNLDEEAAKLLQYQQAYQASSKMIQIAGNLFDSLLQNMR